MNECEHITRLRGHIIEPHKGLREELWRSKIFDPLCWAEHKIKGSSSLHVDSPWIPYAILAGYSVDEINLERKKILELWAMPVCFSLQDYVIPHVRLGLVDPITLRVPKPVIYKIIQRGETLPLEESYWKNLEYKGPFHEF